MKTAVLYAPHDWRIEDVKLSDPGEHECLIKIKACGVCHSEIHQWDHKIEGLEYPRSIGHEVAGVILKVGGGVNNFTKGDQVDGRASCRERV